MWNPLEYIGWGGPPANKAELVQIADVGGEQGFPMESLKDPKTAEEVFVSDVDIEGECKREPVLDLEDPEIDPEDAVSEDRTESKWNLSEYLSLRSWSYKQKELTPEDQVGKNRIQLMRLLKVSKADGDSDYGFHAAYNSLPIYVKTPKNGRVTLEDMSGHNMVRQVTIPSEESNDVLYFKICRKIDPDYQVLLGLFEKRVKSGSEWSLKVCEVPEGSYFHKENWNTETMRVEQVAIPILFENEPSGELDCDVSYKGFYAPSHGKVTGVTLKKLLIKLFKHEEVTLDAYPSEVYKLWRQ